MLFERCCGCNERITGGTIEVHIIWEGFVESQSASINSVRATLAHLREKRGARRFVGFLFAIYIWRLVQFGRFSQFTSLIIIIGGIVLVFPAVWIGRKAVDVKPTIDRLAWITTIVHTCYSSVDIRSQSV